MSDKEVKQILADARDLLATRGWTQGESARSEEGRPTVAYCRTAVSFCSLGAIRRAAHDLNAYLEFSCGAEDKAVDALKDAANLSGWSTDAIVNWNDHPDTTKKDVLQAFNKAIEEA